MVIDVGVGREKYVFILIVFDKALRYVWQAYFKKDYVSMRGAKKEFGPL